MSHGCQLYRHYDSDGTLLYVGVAVNAVRRTREHIKRSDWYDEISRIEIEKFSDRNAALNAEEVRKAGGKPS